MSELTGVNVHIHYYAILREQSGLTRETVNTSASSLKELYDQLQIKHGFSLGLELMKVVVNEEFCNWDAEIKEDDKIVFIPPVAGG